MKKSIKNAFYTSAGLVLVGLNKASAEDANTIFGQSNVTVSGETAALEVAVQGYINTAAAFLAVLAVILAIYGGFNILTAAGEEDKVKKGKTIIIQALIGLVVIFLARSIISWFLGLFTS